MTESISIVASTTEQAIIANMFYHVGHGLSLWYAVEEDLTYFYAAIVAMGGSPADGALTTFQALTTLDQKLTIISKVMSQVFFPDRMEPFRTAAKKKLNRIRTLNEIRNKLGHGRVVISRIEGEESPLFGPYYVEAAQVRAMHLEKGGEITSVVSRQEMWTHDQLVAKVKALWEGRDLSKALLDDLRTIFANEKNTLEKATRLTLDLSTPYAPSPPESAPQYEQER